VIAYFDTSAFVPLLINEPASDHAGSLWEHADRVVSVRLIYPEGRAALARAHRLQRLTADQLRAAVTELDAKTAELDIVDVDDELARRAGGLAESRSLRGYDAVHLAAAYSIRDPDVVVVAGDGALLEAARVEGFAVAAVG
jgi:uncharacterized protein